MNSTWNGIINEIISGKADLALDVAGNFERSRVVEFAYPSIASAMNILVRKDRSYKEQGIRLFCNVTGFAYLQKSVQARFKIRSVPI